MAKWRKQIRLGIIALASFVLLVTVLPQVASGIGLGTLANRLDSTGGCSSSSGSSGSVPSSSSACCSSSSDSSGSSSTCTPSSGNVAGTVAVTGAPNRFNAPYLGVGACPDTGAPLVCANPTYVFSYDGTYSMTLAPGTWRISAFYELNPYGGAFLGTGLVINVVDGQPLTENLTVPYARPASIAGKIQVTGVPSGVQVEETSVLLCPPSTPVTNSGQFSIACVNDTYQPGPATGTYRISGLPPVTWIAYPSYCTQFGCATNAEAGQSVTLNPGRRTHLNLTTPFILPGEGLAAGTVAITGAPAGFSAQMGVSACELSTAVNLCQETSTLPDGSFDLLLSDGTWQIGGVYYAAPFDNTIPGPVQTVTIAGGQITSLNLAVPYQVLGTAAGSITVTGRPAGVKITSYTVMACPATTAPDNFFPSLSCVTEYSGPGGYTYGATDSKRLATPSGKPTKAKHLRGAGTRLNSYTLPTLTAGQWILYPSYQTAFGTYSTSTGTTVTIAAGKTTATRLTMPYQTPDVGMVTGAVSVTGAPQYGFYSGVRACNAAPTTSCPGEVDASSQLDGSYQLSLPPGTWWISGVAYLYTTGLSTEVATTPRPITVSAGSHAVERFTVAVS